MSGHLTTIFGGELKISFFNETIYTDNSHCVVGVVQLHY